MIDEVRGMIDPDVVVIGGASGAAIAHTLAERGRRVTLLCRTDMKGATDSNQKWLHSGLLYPSGRLAEKAWVNRNAEWGLKREYIEGVEGAYLVTRSAKTFHARTLKWQKWATDGRSVAPHERLTDADRAALQAVNVQFEDGCKTPDCAINFPKLVTDLRRNLEAKLVKNSHLPQLRTIGTVLDGAKVLRIRIGRSGVWGVDYIDGDGKPDTLRCNDCVVAAGAWSYDLLRDIGVSLPVIRKKCIVLAYKERLVDRITICLDVTKDDGTEGDATLVPFGDETLVAGTDFRVVYAAQGIENLVAGRLEVEALRSELHQFFPAAAQCEFEPRVCVKTEHFNPAHPDVDVRIYTDEAARGFAHGIKGLIVALPGKASLMFDLARKVADALAC